MTGAPTTIRLPWPKPPLTGNRTRGNPYARAVEVKATVEGAQYAIRAAKPKPMVGANVTLHFRPKDRRRRDADGMYPTLKAIQDALVLEGVLPDDSWVCVPSATCRIHEPNGEGPAMWVELVDPDAGAA
jgi:crossover junction endodeoxyribonuclease RusA